MFDWQLYYTDGSTFSNLDGTPYDAPDREVQFVVSKQDDQRFMILSGADYYIYEDSFGWWYTNEDGKVSHQLRDVPECIKHGAMMGFKEFVALTGRVHKELPGYKHSWRQWKYQQNPGYAYIIGEPIAEA